MPTARYWHCGRLMLTWLAAVFAFATIRWSMLAGVYQSSIENQKITRLEGLWTPSFATAMIWAAAGTMALTLLWATGTWIAGRQARRDRLAAATAGHRKLLM